MFVRAKKRGNRTYLMIVRNERVNGRVKQRVLHSLGRLDVLLENGELDALLASAQRFSEESAVHQGPNRGGAVRAQPEFAHDIGHSVLRYDVDLFRDRLRQGRT